MARKKTNQEPMIGDPELREIPVVDVIPTPDNPRRAPKTTDPDIIELAASIKAHGLLHPVVCRPHATKSGKFDLRAGARRLTAHKVLKAKTILAIVRGMTDQQAVEVTAMENLQRVDLSPLEEGRSISMMLNAGGDAEAIASRCGRSVSWIYRRAVLSRLESQWAEAVEADSPVGNWSAAHIALVARLPEDAQKRAYAEMHPEKNDYLRGMTVAALRDTLSRFHRTIEDVPAAFLRMAPNCFDCPLYGNREPELFEPDEVNEFRCHGPDCLADKLVSWKKGALYDAMTLHPALLLMTYAWNARYRDDIIRENPHTGDDITDRILGREDYIEVEEGDEGAVKAFCCDTDVTCSYVYIRIKKLASGGNDDGDNGDDDNSRPGGVDDRKASPVSQRRETLTAMITEVIEPMTYEGIQKRVKGLSLVSLLIGMTAIYHHDYESEDITGLFYSGDGSDTWPGDMQAMVRIFETLDADEPVDIAQDRLIWRILKGYLSGSMPRYHLAHSLDESIALVKVLFRAGIITDEVYRKAVIELQRSEED